MHDSKVITVLSDPERQHLATVIRLVTPIATSLDTQRNRWTNGGAKMLKV